MIKKLLKRSLLQGVVFIILSGSLLVGADKKPKVLGQAPQKDQSYKKYNDLANTLHEEKDPTDETIAEFKAALEKDKQFYSRRKECKTELDLLLQDKMAQVEARKLMPAEVELPPHTATEEGEVKTEPTELSEKQQTPATESKPITQPSLEPSKPIVTPSTPVTPIKPTLAESLISEPLIEPAKTPARKLTPEAIRNFATLVAGKQKGYAQQTSPQLTALLQKTVSGVPKQKPVTPTPRATEQPAVLLLQEFAELKKAGIAQPTKDDLQIISYAQPTLFTEIVQPLMTLAKKESQENKARKVIETTIHVLPTFTPQTQKHVTDRMADVLKWAQEAEGKRTLITQMQELTQKMLNQRINTPMLKENLHAVGVDDIIPRISDPTKPEQQTISFDMLKPVIFRVAWRGNLDFAKTTAIANTIADATALITRETDKFAPLAGTALVVAPNKESVHDITQAFAIKLDLFDIGMDTVQSRGAKLFKEIEDTRLTKGWAKNLTWAFSLGTSTYRKPEQIIPEIIALYYMLQTVGRETVYSIEQAEKNTLYLMDAQTQEQWQQGSLDMAPYIDNRQNLGYTHTKRNYATELEKEISAIETKILEEIAYLGNTPIAKEMEDLLNQAKVPLTKYYARAQEEAAKQYEQNMKALPEPEIIPAKSERTKQRTRLPGRPTLETTARKIKPKVKPIAPIAKKEPETPTITTPIAPEIKPITPEVAKPVEAEKPQKFEPIVPATEEDIKTLPQVGPQKIKIPKTASNVLTLSTRQQVDDIKREVSRINILKNNVTDIERIKEKASTLSTEQISLLGSNELEALAQNLSQLEDQIQQVAKIRDVIDTLESKSASELSGIKEDLLAILKTLPTDAYNELKKQFEAAATGYAIQLIDPLTILINLHQNIANDITQLEHLPDNLLNTVKTLSELTNFLDENNKKALQDIFIGLCALYDALLFVLFKPDNFTAAIAKLPEIKQIEDPVAAYKQLVEMVRDMIEGLEYTDALNAYFPLLNEDTREKVRTGKYDLTKTNTVGLTNDAGTYIYALKEGAPINIDDITTLFEITPDHTKQYSTILDQWYNRINKNDIIKQLITFRDNPTKAYTPEELQEIQAAINDLQGLLPEKFFTDLRDATTDSDAFKNAQKGIDIKNKITELKERIIAAHEKFKTSTPKVVEDIGFRIKYTVIQKAIEDDATEDQRPALLAELNTVLTPYNAYLTDVAASYTIVFKSLPTNAFSMAADVETNIKDKTATIKKMSTLNSMLKELDNLNLLNAETEFKTLYRELLKGYGYILATFDALNAKLVDTAKVETGFISAFFNNQIPTYKTAQKIIQLLGLVAKLRSDYYTTLLQEYFGNTTELQQYKAGSLNVIDLGVENVGTKDKYDYARTQIEGYKGKPDIIFPTGNHVPSPAKQPYMDVINKWTSFIETSLKSTATAERTQRVEKTLKNILDTKVYGVPFKDIHTQEKNNFFDMLTAIVEEAVTIQSKLTKKAAPEQLINAAYEQLQKQPAETYMPLVTKQLIPALLQDLKQLKADKELTDTIQNLIAQLCGNSFALVEGLIHWIYTETNGSDASYTKLVETIATALQAPITQLAQKTTEFLPYTSKTEFNSLATYAPAITAESEIPQAVKYRYYIAQAATANIKEIGTITYNGIPLKQVGTTLTKQALEKQIATLNALIASLQSPANRFVTKASDTIELIQALEKTADNAQIDQLTNKIRDSFKTLAQETNVAPQTAESILTEIAKALIGAYQGAE